jgi:hypothetical protein
MINVEHIVTVFFYFLLLFPTSSKPMDNLQNSHLYLVTSKHGETLEVLM